MKYVTLVFITLLAGCAEADLPIANNKDIDMLYRLHYQQAVQIDELKTDVCALRKLHYPEQMPGYCLIKKLPTE